MNLQKDKIKQNFNRASHTYDAMADVQKQCAFQLIKQLREVLPHFQPKTILDVGTGTGYLPELLLPIFPNSQFTLNDFAEDMLGKTQEKLGPARNINYLVADMNTYDFAFNDLVVSSFTLQWARDLKQSLKKFYEQSEVFAFSCLLEGNFKEWADLFENLALPVPISSYPTQQDLENYLLSLAPKNYDFFSQEFKLDFKNPSEFIKYLKCLGANYSPQTFDAGHLKQVLEQYNRPLSVTYKVFFGILA